MISVELLPGCPDDLQVHLVDNGSVRLALLPSVGGRLLGAALDGHELLWHNPRLFDHDLVPRPRREWPVSDGTLATWSNPGGSKVWPAPEGTGPGEWPGPPEPVLESGPWALSGPHASTGSATSAAPDAPPATEVSMTSPPDPWTGLQVTRTLRLGDTGTTFAEEVVFANVVDRPVRWAVWQVCQVGVPGTGTSAGLGRVEVRVAPGGDHDRPQVRGPRVGSPTVVDPGDGVVRIPVTDFIGKLGFPGAVGDVCYRSAQGTVLRLVATSATGAGRGAEYPYGSRVDLWFQRPSEAGLGADFRFLHPRDRYVELETFSPLVTIAPGASARCSFVWSLAALGRDREVDR